MDSLKEYNEKREFDHTPEPKGIPKDPELKNRFVVQRHMARREHYDFRLQVGDRLLSWAIPKKPVYDPEVKRLAIKVEDHPVEYLNFEGNIPKGNYGAGTVMVWDIGYYYLNADREFPTEIMMKHKIQKGDFKLYLQGTKLKGFFNLVKIKTSEKDEWLFMKAPEENEKDFEDLSALTGRSIEEISKSDIIWDADKPPAEAKTVNNTSHKAEKRNFPGFIKPMLATLTDKAFSGKDWIFEEKFDGYRIISGKEKKDVRLYSRNGNLFNERFPLIAEELMSINADFIIDGEVCYVDSAKKTNFQKLQNKVKDQEKLQYYVFDLLWLNNHDLLNLPLTERKKLLEILLKNSRENIHYVEHTINHGEEFYKKVEEEQLEGMIAKRAGSLYYPGDRSDYWLKIKTGYSQEMIICGFTPSENEPGLFSSLLCAVNDKEGLIYTGRVGTGFNENSRKDISAKLKKLKTSKIPVINPPSGMKIEWVKPELICEVRFSSWTNDKIMRHPSFKGLRSDKDLRQIVLEKPEPVKEIIASEPKINSKKTTASKPAISKRVILTNPDKIFWPDEGITKNDVIEYYRDIADIILPYLKDRPQSLYRTPDGIKSKGFFQKNVKEIAPDWVETINIENSKGGTIEYLLCQNSDTLLYMVNLGCIELNPWSSSLPDLDNPDFMIFDLDPVDVDFSEVVNIAVEFKKVFDQLSMPAYCKTSGSRGIHIYVPVQQKYTYPQVQTFVKLIEDHIHQKFKNITSFERSPSARKGKIYLDFLQNAKGKTMSSVYSIRPRPGATVSAPIAWDELTPDLNIQQFNIRNMRSRLFEVGDLWQGFFDQRVDMKNVLEKMA